MCDQGSEMIEVKLAHTTKGKKTHAKVDRCIASIIQMFNDAGYQTVASCCGHGVRPGVISLENGTELILCYSYEQTRMIEKLYPGLHEEMDGVLPPPMNVDDYGKLVSELEYANADLVIKRDVDQQKMQVQWEEIQEFKRLENELKLQTQDNERIIQASKAAVDTMRNDRDGQKAGWDASSAVIDKLVTELNNQRDENAELKKENEDLGNEVESYMKTVDIYREGHTHEELKNIEVMKNDIDELRFMVKEAEAERDSLRVTISAVRGASKFKKEYDPKWQNEVARLNNVVLSKDKDLLEHREEISRLTKEPDRIHGHWHRQTSGYMNKIKNQRRQLKRDATGHARLRQRVDTLYPYIVHGDMDHRKWLRKAIDEHFDMSGPDRHPKLGMDFSKATLTKIENMPKRDMNQKHRFLSIDEIHDRWGSPEGEDNE